MVLESSEAVEAFKQFMALKADSIIKNQRFILDINEVRQFNRDLADIILSDPQAIVPFFQEELKEHFVENLGVVGSFGHYTVTPRTISSSFISKMICCSGIVTSVSLVRPKIRKSVHYDYLKQEFLEKEYRDSTMIGKLPPTNTVYPTSVENRPLNSEFGLSKYLDFQTVILQEMPENSPPGQLPRSVEVILSNDLVDKVKPGDRVAVYGIYKSFTGLHSSEFPTKFRTVLIANHVVQLKATEEFETPDIDKIEMVASSDIKFRAIAPTIFGHDDIKKALALQMVGGNEVVMANGSKIRGDINILLVGDPSTAKSQLLRFMLNFLPLSIATTGRGSSGVGLTAAVVIDKETGDKRLEAGAMVLGDRGIVCIDEFDKMSDLDRVAIHEVMEQQTVTIAKAGIHTTLNARCSVLAAANPILGSYNERMTPQENVRLPESLMTRFDLVFVTLDNIDADSDNKISQHVIKMHRDNCEDFQEDAISQKLFKEYILYAKGLRPKLSQGAGREISKAYTKMRESKNNKNLLVNITPRLLETMIRIATGYSKLRLSDIVEEEDAKEAIDLINKSIVKKKIRKRTVKREVRAPYMSIAEEIAKIDIGEEKEISNIFEGGEDEINVENPPQQENELKDDKDTILDEIWKWKESHLEDGFCDMKILSEHTGIALDAITAVAEELSAQDIVMVDEGKIFFLD